MATEGDTTIQFPTISCVGRWALASQFLYLVRSRLVQHQRSLVAECSLYLDLLHTLQALIGGLSIAIATTEKFLALDSIYPSSYAAAAVASVPD